jgi:Lsr2
MAQKIQTLYVDDLDGSAAEGTVTFGLEGSTYEIDLNAEHRAALRDMMSTYIQAGRKISGAGRGRTAGRGSQRSGDRPDAKQVREWAKENGMTINDRGRIPEEFMVKFQSAHTG